MRYFYFNPLTQYENMGDLLINKSLLNLLRRYGTIIIDDRNKPVWFVNELKKESDLIVSEIFPKNLGNYLEDVLLENKEEDDICYQVFVPGDKSRKGFKKAIWSLKHFYKLVKQKQKGCRSIRLGFSIGDFDTANLITESLYSLAFHTYGIRDSISMHYARKFRFSNTVFFPDLAWAYEDYEDVPNPVNESSRYIVLSFRANKVGTVYQSSYLSTAIDRLKKLFDVDWFNGVKIVISYQVAFDREACIQLRDALQNSGDICFVDKLLTINEAIALYKGAEMTLSNRLHVLLLASISGCFAVPFINSAHNKKIVGIYQDNDLSDLIVDYNSSETSMLDKLQGLIGEKDFVLKRLAEKRFDNIAQIKAVLNSILVK